MRIIYLILLFGFIVASCGSGKDCGCRSRGMVQNSKNISDQNSQMNFSERYLSLTK